MQPPDANNKSSSADTGTSEARSASASSGPVPITIRNLIDVLVAQRPMLAELTRGILGRWRKSTLLNAAWLAKFSTQAEAIRREVATGVKTGSKNQFGFHTIMELTLPYLGPTAGAALHDLELRNQVIQLRTLMGFSLTKNEHSMLTKLADLSQAKITDQAWVELANLQRMERRLHLGTPITRRLPIPAPEFNLESVYDKPLDAFAKRLQLERLHAELTPKELAKRACVPLSQIHAWERGAGVPGQDNVEAVMRLMHTLKCPSLQADYCVSRVARDKLKPKAPSRSIFFGDYVSPAHEVQILEVLASEDDRYDVPRAGKKASGGPLADSSHRKYRQILSRCYCVAQLPNDDSDPRGRGLGWLGTDTGLIDFGMPEFVKKMFAWHLRRNDRTDFARSDADILGKLADLFRPHTGYVWQNAEKLAVTASPASIKRCPSSWPEGSDRPGQPCLDAAEKIRARCYEAQAYLLKRARKANGCAPSADHLKCLTAAMTYHHHLLEALFVLLREGKQGRPTTAAEAFKVAALAILAIACWHPLRASDYGEMLLADLVLRPDGGVALRFHPQKNGDSFRARYDRVRTMPPELAHYVVEYLLYARPLLAALDNAAQTRLFPNARGKILTGKNVQRMFQFLVATNEETIKLFPHGLLPRYTRTIVATDLATRFGLEMGSKLGAAALVDHEITVIEHYIVVEPDPDLQQVGEATQAAAIAAAYRKIFGRSPRKRKAA